MGISHFQQNVEVEISGKTYKLLRKVADDLWQLEETKTKRIIEHTDPQLRSLYADRQLVFPNKHFSRDQNDNSEIGVVHQEISEKKFEAAKIRRIYALAVWDVPNTQLAMTPAILDTWKKLKSPASPPYWTTVFRWKTRFANAGKDIHALVDDDQKKGNRTNRYEQEVREVIMNAIETIYLTLEC
ncbi:hypothetical protein ACO0LF_18000 [Undibacterium sp. Di27W]|uniref:hypothetical protein n=1 Tax=Undibacterium sp. Di27W TaxID=3413036 RepID=UPI003BF3A184